MKRRAAETHVREGLTLTKRLHKEIGELGIDPDVAKTLKSKVAEANKLLVTLRRQLHLDDVANEVRHRVMLAAIKEELIDRDANAARVAERLRIMTDRTSDGSSLANRSSDAAQQIAANISGLCPWQMRLSQSVPMLAASSSNES